MNIVIYANCQALGIEKFLNIAFKNKVNILTLLNFEKLYNKTDLSYDLTSKSSVFIYQPIDKSHGKYSTDPSVSDSIINYIPDECVKISMPYVYNNSFWSTFKEDEKIENSEIILQLKNKGFTLNDILYMYDNFELDFKYNERNKRCLNILRERESTCNIKIADFVEDNMKNTKLFLTQNHPTTTIFVNMTNQILSLIGCNEKINPELYTENHTNLPGLYPHNKYDIDYWKFKYSAKCDGDEWTKLLIKQIYDK